MNLQLLVGMSMWLGVRNDHQGMITDVLFRDTMWPCNVASNKMRPKSLNKGIT